MKVEARQMFPGVGIGRIDIMDTPLMFPSLFLDISNHTQNSQNTKPRNHHFKPYPKCCFHTHGTSLHGAALARFESHAASAPAFSMSPTMIFTSPPWVLLFQQQQIKPRMVWIGWASSGHHCFQTEYEHVFSRKTVCSLRDWQRLADLICVMISHCVSNLMTVKFATDRGRVRVWPFDCSLVIFLSIASFDVQW